MPRFEKRKWNQFYDFLTERDGGTRGDPVAELRADLRHWGVDVDRVDAKVAETVKLWRRRESLTWLTQARKSQQDFETKLKNKKEWISQTFKSAKELWGAIADGSLGTPVQAHAGVFFRNEDGSKASEEDLRSFIDDCELLGILEDPKKGARKK